MKPKLLVHVCCGVCGVYVLKQLKKDFAVTAYFFNPNIQPKEEYLRRLEAVKEICKAEDRPLSSQRSVLCGIPLVEGEYEPEKWSAYLKQNSNFDLEKEPEGGRRCVLCFKMRLEETGRLAKEKGFEWFTTTLTMGRNKKAVVINAIGQGVAKKYGLRFYEADWKKQEGEKQAHKLAKEKGLYRQNYCGCEFSRRKEK